MQVALTQKHGKFQQRKRNKAVKRLILTLKELEHSGHNFATLHIHLMVARN